MKHPHIVLCSFLVLLLLTSASATQSEVSLNAGLRKIFIKAENRARQGKPVANSVKALLKHYPLYPYLEYAELRNRLSTTPRAIIEKFLSEHAQTPLAELLRRRWLFSLARHKRWSEYIEAYQPQHSIKLQCHHLNALIQTGQQQLAFSKVKPLWLHGKSRPKACDPVFAAWKKAGLLTPDLVWQRFERVMDKGQLKLAAYLLKQLPRKEQPWARLWIQLYRQPDKLLTASLLKKPHQYRDEMVVDAMDRKIRINPVTAIDFWKKVRKRIDMSLPSQHLVERKLVFWLTRQEDPKAWAFIAAVQPCGHDSKLHAALVRAALYRQQWEQVAAWIERMPPADQNSERWRYWRARAHEQLGDNQSAQTIYRKLANNRSYYGFLAADHVDADYHLRNRNTLVTSAEIQALEKTANVQRIKELIALERWLEARREWRFLTHDMSEDEYMAAAELAQSWGWHDQAIFTLAKSGYWDDLDLRFPLEHKELVTEHAQKHQLDSSWVYGVIRQESAFNTSVRSHAGAVGLMQLMPATAKFVAHKLLKRKKSPSYRELTDPKTNIELGTTYLANVKSSFSNNPVLATAAYNAGPHRVKRWLPRNTLDADIWVELIPFKETRQYVQRVFTYASIYDRRMKKPVSRLAQRMPPIQGTDMAQSAENSQSTPASTAL